MSGHPLDFIFHPKSIAVVGASDNPVKWGYVYLRYFLDYGYRGTIYPIATGRSEVLGLRAYPSVTQVPDSIDYVVSCIPFVRTPQLLTECFQKGIKFVHILAGQAAETGRKDSAELENELLRQARSYGIRLLGPNCMGIYYPKVGLSTGFDFPKTPGSVGVLTQSGGFSTDLIRFSSLRGLRFSKVISYGNAVDLNESDFLDYLSQDPETKIILGYLEGVKDGRQFLNALRNAASLKPVILLKGGRTGSGTRAIATHTASLTSPMRVWEVAIKQAGAILTRDLDEIIDLAVAFNFLSPITGARVGIVGGSGGRVVLSSDECEELGFNVVPLPPEINEKIKDKDLTIWKWLINPVDVSVLHGSAISISDVVTLMAESPGFDFLIANVSESWPFTKKSTTTYVKNEVKAYITASKKGLKPLVVILSDRGLGIKDMDNWRWRLYAELRTQLINAHVPFYPNIGQAAKAVRELIAYYQRESVISG